MIDIVQNKILITNLLSSVERDGIGDLLKYLDQVNFFTIELEPTEPGYFQNLKGSLAQHSIDTYNVLTKLNDIFGLNIPLNSIIITSLLHDVCRCDINNKFPVGHGEKSVFIIQRFIKLTDDEIIAINAHMGFTDPRNINRDIIEKSYDICPLALFLYNSDIIAATYIERNS